MCHFSNTGTRLRTPTSPSLPSTSPPSGPTQPQSHSVINQRVPVGGHQCGVPSGHRRTENRIPRGLRAVALFQQSWALPPGPRTSTENQQTRGVRSTRTRPRVPSGDRQVQPSPSEYVSETRSLPIKTQKFPMEKIKVSTMPRKI